MGASSTFKLSLDVSLTPSDPIPLDVEATPKPPSVADGGAMVDGTTSPIASHFSVQSN